MARGGPCRQSGSAAGNYQIVRPHYIEINDRVNCSIELLVYTLAYVLNKDRVKETHTSQRQRQHQQAMASSQSAAADCTGCATLTVALDRARRDAVQALVDTEAEQEGITNRLLTKVSQMKRESNALRVQVDAEEEFISNTLQRRLTDVLREKDGVEKALNAAREDLANTKLTLRQTQTELHNDEAQLREAARERVALEVTMECEQEMVSNRLTRQLQSALRDKVDAEARALALASALDSAIGAITDALASNSGSPPSCVPVVTEELARLKMALRAWGEPAPTQSPSLALPSASRGPGSVRLGGRPTRSDSLASAVSVQGSVGPSASAQGPGSRQPSLPPTPRLMGSGASSSLAGASGGGGGGAHTPARSPGLRFSSSPVGEGFPAGRGSLPAVAVATAGDAPGSPGGHRGSHTPGGHVGPSSHIDHAALAAIIEPLRDENVRLRNEVFLLQRRLADATGQLWGAGGIASSADGQRGKSVSQDVDGQGIGRSDGHGAGGSSDVGRSPASASRALFPHKASAAGFGTGAVSGAAPSSAVSSPPASEPGSMQRRSRGVSLDSFGGMSIATTSTAAQPGPPAETAGVKVV